MKRLSNVLDEVIRNGWVGFVTQQKTRWKIDDETRSFHVQWLNETIAGTKKVYGEGANVLFAKHPLYILLIVREFHWPTRLIAPAKQQRLRGIELSF